MLDLIGISKAYSSHVAFGATILIACFTPWIVERVISDDDEERPIWRILGLIFLVIALSWVASTISTIIVGVLLGVTFKVVHHWIKNRIGLGAKTVTIFTVLSIFFTSLALTLMSALPPLLVKEALSLNEVLISILSAGTFLFYCIAIFYQIALWIFRPTVKTE